jgi:hypothetical protein
MRVQRLSVVLLLAALLLGGLGGPAPSAGAQGEACFAETGQCLRGRFLDYWQRNGGLARNGFPLTDERRELLEDGREYTVQYFERVRLEYHPEHAPPYDVLLGQFGRRVLREEYVVSREGYEQATRPVAASGPYYFPQTGHTIAPQFQAYWEANGGLAQFGYPITEERYDSLPNREGACCVTQYFERARFEYHPEHAGTEYEVLLGQFGRRLLEDNALLEGDLGRFFLGSERARGLLGRPQGLAVASAGATQAFERGRMFFVEDAPPFVAYQGRWDGGRTIVTLCTEEFSGGPTVSRVFFHRDTWDESQSAGGGPGPQPGLYEPRRGFGKVWREEPRVRACLGYATEEGEAAFPVVMQGFRGGYLLLSDAPAERAIYALWSRNTCNSCAPSYAHERFLVPPR